MTKYYGAIIVALVLVWVAPLGASAQAKPKIDLTGTWVLNRDLSDKPGQGGGRDPSAGGGGRRRGPMGGMSGGMGGRQGGQGGQMAGREDMERLRAAMDAAVRAAGRLIIVNADPGLIITDDEGVSTRLALDGKKETGAINGVPFETVTKWENDTLHVEKKFKGGLKVDEIYSVSADPRLLTILTRIEGRGAERSITRVYDLKEPGF